MKIAQHWKILIGLLLGVVWAFVGLQVGWQKFTINWILPFGTIFINLLKLIAIPLVLFSIIKGISDLQDIGKLGKLGIRTLALYIISTVLAITIGLAMVNIWKPGAGLSEELAIKNRLSYELWVSQTEGVEIKDNKNYLGNDKYSAYLDDAQKDLENLSNNETAKAKTENALKRKDEGPLQILIDMVPSNIFLALSSNGLMLQIIFFALFFGVVLLLIDKEKAEPVAKLVDGLNDVFLKMVDIVMMAAPFFVFALMAGMLTKMAEDNLNNLGEILYYLIRYSATVVGGLAIMVVLVYPTAITLLVRKLNVFSFLKGIRKAQTLAFSTSSSAATLPVTMQCVNEQLGVPKKISSFVLPIGATVNMDGTSLYIAVAVVFLAQFHSIDLSLVQQLTIVLTATLASIGASAVPSAGLIMMIMVLQSVGLNPLWISIIFPVDRILDMCRTVVNVTGDAAVATIVGQIDE
ncbi:cation:dicarboxylase symporter family transporter [bacterium]|nr:cation:dicarboxylase symporter family transporter [bacterium]